MSDKIKNLLNRVTEVDADDVARELNKLGSDKRQALWKEATERVATDADRRHQEGPGGPQGRPRRG
jgi:hypothetical protein